MADVRLVILDVEGVVTLAGGSQYPWPLAEMVDLRRLLRTAELPCVLCTGRQEPYGEAVIQALDAFQPLPQAERDRMRSASGVDFVSWPSVLEHGAYLYDPLAKRAILHPALTAERVAQLQHLKAETLSPLVGKTGAQFEPGKDFCLSLNPPPVNGSGSERQSTAEFRPIVDEALRGYEDLVEVSHSKSAIDITPRGVSKASAVRLILEWTGLEPGCVLGVGDTAADSAWLQVVGLRAAPANGRDALPGMDYYSSLEVAEGLLDILQWAINRSADAEDDRLQREACREYDEVRVRGEVELIPAAEVRTRLGL